MGEKIQATLKSIGIVAHDMKNPIATIRLSAGIMAKMAKTDLELRQAKAILQSSYLLERQVNMYSDLLKLETSGRIDLHTKEYGSNFIELLYSKLAKTYSQERLDLNYPDTEFTAVLQIDLTRLTTAIQGICDAIVPYMNKESKISISSSLQMETLELLLEFQLRPDVTVDTDDLFKKSFVGQDNPEVMGRSVEMFLANEIVKEHKGNINVQCNSDKVIFKLTINS